jgi:hypothetical protein
METESRLHFGCGDCFGRRLPTMVGIRPFRHQLCPSSSLDYLESATIQHSSSRSGNSLMELYDFQHLRLGLSARGYSSRRCRQHHPSQTVSPRRTRSVRSCPSRLRCRDKLRYNELLSFPLLCLWTNRKRVGFWNPKPWSCLGIPEWILHLPSGGAGLGCGTFVQFPTFWKPGHKWGNEDSPVHRKFGGIVSEVWVKPAVSVKVLFKLWPGPEPQLGGSQYFLKPFTAQCPAYSGSFLY